jgi:hypothetical protein
MLGSLLPTAANITAKKINTIEIVDFVQKCEVLMFKAAKKGVCNPCEQCAKPPSHFFPVPQ